jgi:SAM-dependent methyltransferase
MSKIFEKYGELYNALYHNKEYNEEADFLVSIVNSLSESSETLLELGCGTGNHIKFLETFFTDIVGVDMSPIMIDRAPKLPNVKYLVSRIQELDLSDKFDVVLSLFHVFSYQKTNEDIHSFFKCVRDHVKPGGVVIFDCWNASGVFIQKPEQRYRCVDMGDTVLHRFARPQVSYEQNVVNVFYDFIVERDKTVEKFNEVHTMRYFSAPEIQFMANSYNFELVDAYDGFSLNEPKNDTWSTLYVLKDKGCE